MTYDHVALRWIYFLLIVLVCGVALALSVKGWLWPEAPAWFLLIPLGIALSIAWRWTRRGW